MGALASREEDVARINEEGRYAVVGIVVDFDPARGEGRLDDGTGVLRIVLDNLLYAEDLQVGSFVRVVGRVYMASDGKIMKVEVAHRMGVPPDLYKKVRELERRVLHESRL